MRWPRWPSTTRRAPSSSARELGEFLQLCDEDELDPLSALGSYAGAMGAAQFMPSSYRNFAVNAGRHRPTRDLWSDWGDIFASIANYLHVHGWQYGRAGAGETRPPDGTVPTVADRVALDTTVGALQRRRASRSTRRCRPRRQPCS